MPAAAVIPAPIAYIKVVAVKKLVVGFLVGGKGGMKCQLASPAILLLTWYGILLLTSGSDILP